MLTIVEAVEYVFICLSAVVSALWATSAGAEVLQWLTKYLKSDKEMIEL